MKRFLVVDDDGLSRAILVDFFSEFAVCDSASDGRNGYELFEKALLDGQPYSLVCSDIVMPVCDGHEMVAQVRAREESLQITGSCRTKIFMITASGTPKDMQYAIFDNNCDDYIVKPFQREALTSMLLKYDLIDSSITGQ